MRHRKQGRHLGRNASHRKALRQNLSISLFKNERIVTTPQKAKEVRPFAEKIITLAKERSLANIRRVAKLLQDKQIVRKLFDQIGPRYAERPGGYTRIMRRGHRQLGDGAQTAILELVEEKMKKASAKPKAKTTQEKMPAPQEDESQSSN